MGSLLLTSCGIQWQYSTLNHAGHNPKYNTVIKLPDDLVVDTLSYFDLQRKLRNDFVFRHNFALYASNQPYSWYFNNPMFNRYNYWSPFNSFDFYTNRYWFWNDWAFNYSWYSPHRWSFFGYDRWGYNHYGWNNYGWNSWGWNGYYGNNWGWRQQMNNYAWNNRYRRNTVYVNGRRGSTITIQDRIGQSSMIESTKRSIKVDNKREKIYINNSRPNNNRPTINNSRPRINNTRPTINNNTRPRVNNSRPVINRSTPTRTNNNPSRNNTTNNRRKN